MEINFKGKCVSFIDHKIRAWKRPHWRVFHVIESNNKCMPKRALWIFDHYRGDIPEEKMQVKGTQAIGPRIMLGVLLQGMKKGTLTKISCFVVVSVWFLVAPCWSQGATLQVTLRCHLSGSLSVHGRTPLCWIDHPLPPVNSTQLNSKGYTKAHWLAC